MAYLRDGQLGQAATRSPACAAAFRAARQNADPVSATLIRLLERPIPAGRTPALARRADELRALVDGLDRDQACRLSRRLADRADPLALSFDCELSTALRNELRARLERSCRRAPPPSGPTPVPAPSPAPVPLPRPWSPQWPHWPRSDRPRISNGWPPPDPRPRIPVRELLEHARRILDALRAAGYTGAIVVALATVIAEVTALLAVLQVTRYLLFDVAAGQLGVDATLITHQAERYITNQAGNRPEWPRLEQALQRLHRLDQRAVELLGQRQPAEAAQPGPPSGRIRERLPSAPEQRPPERPSDPNRRIVVLFHGTTARRASQIVRDQAFARRTTWFALGQANEDLARIFAIRASNKNPRDGGPAIVAVRLDEGELDRLRQLRLFHRRPFDPEDPPELRNRIQWVLEPGGVENFNQALEDVEQLRW